MSKKFFLKDSAIYLIGELFSKMIPFLLLPYLSRKLGAEGYGELSYYQTGIALLAILLGLSQEGAIARYFYFYGKRSLDFVLKTGYSYTIISGAIFLIFAFIFKAEIFVYLILIAIFQCFLNVQLAVRQCQKQAIPYTSIQLLSGITLTLITIFMLEFYSENLVEKRILAVLFSNILVFLIAYFFYRSKNQRKSTFSWRKYRISLLYIFSFGIPLLFHHISLFVRGQIDRVFIYHQFSEAELGLYAMGATIASIFMVFIMAINKATIPYFYEALKKQSINLTHIHRWALISLFLVPIPSLLLFFIPEEWVVWLLGEAFLGTKYYIVLFLLATSLGIPYLLLVNYLFYYGKNKLISYCSIISTLVYLIALFILSQSKIEYIPFASIIGALSILPVLYFMTKYVSKRIK